MKKFLVGSLICIALSTSANAATFEDWTAPQVSVAGTYESHAPDPNKTPDHSNPENSEIITINNPSGKWLTNNWKPDCVGNPSGPNPCYAPNNGELLFNAEASVYGGGFLLASTQLFSFVNGISVEVPVRAYCTQYVANVAPGCGVNVGLYRGEQNYRSFGFSNTGGSLPIYANIWGPSLEAHFDGAAPLYNSIPINGNVYKTVKVQYWLGSSGWRWDYFLDGNWIAGHEAINDAFNLGSGYFPDKQVRIQIGAYGYTRRPDDWQGPYNGGEGAFGQVIVNTF